MTTPTRDEAVPSGWKLVPVEPTPEMYIKGGSAMLDARHNAETAADEACACYAAMLDSAPAPASGGVDAVARRAKYLLSRLETDDGLGMGEIDTMLRMAASLSTAATPVSEADMIPRAKNVGRYLAETNDGRLLYLNHATEWQEMPNILAKLLDEATHDR